MDQETKSGPSSPKVIAVVGAGPKAAALAAKARVLKDLGIGEVIIKVIDRNEAAANWKGGSYGFTDGKGSLGTPPEKDIGFPYSSVYGSEVDIAMLKYSWQAHLITAISKTLYADWVDRGRPQPRHGVWAEYLETVLRVALPAEDIIEDTVVSGVSPINEKLQLSMIHRNQIKTLEADAIVFTGPGEPIMFERVPANPDLILDGRSYWKNIHKFEVMTHGNVAIIGGGETAASIAISLLDRSPQLRISIINRHGTIFTRGESFQENRIFSNPDEWMRLDEFTRKEFIQRTDRGVFSVAAQRRLDHSENVSTISGEVFELLEERNQVIVRIRRGDPPRGLDYEYDMAIVALGFDPWTPLEMFPEDKRPDTSPESLKQLELRVDEYLRLPFDSAPQVSVHMPMVAALRQGPGFPNLSCLGHLSDRILKFYIPAPRSKQT